MERKQPDLAGRILAALNFSEAWQFQEMLNKLLGEKEEISAEEIKRYSKLSIQTKNIANCVVKPTEEDISTMFALSFAKQPNFRSEGQEGYKGVLGNGFDH